MFLGFFWREGWGWVGWLLGFFETLTLADLSRGLLLEAPNLSSHLSSLLRTLSEQIQQILFLNISLCLREIENALVPKKD